MFINKKLHMLEKQKVADYLNKVTTSDHVEHSQWNDTDQASIKHSITLQ